MKKICNLAIMYPRDDVRIFRKECVIETQNYEVHYITCDGKGYELKNNIYIHGIKRYQSILLRMIFAPFRVCREAKLIDADIYVLHDPVLLSVALLLKKRGKCVVWDCHEFYGKSPEFFSPVSRKLIFFFRHIRNFVVPYLDGLITVTEELEDFF